MTAVRRLVLAAAAALCLVPAAPAGAAPLRYVALGDSYSAASGVLPLDPAAFPGCLRSTRNYPKLLAGFLGTTVRDVTCGAAETKDFRAAQYDGVAPQLDALGADTELVTLTIGGNDSGVFIRTILGCGAAALTTAGQGSPCREQYGTSFEDTIRDVTFPALVQALRDVRERAPRATVAVLTYPMIMPPSGGCFEKMPVATGDVPYVHGIQLVLNDAVRRAARETGALLVDLDGPSTGHDACQADGVRWVEPVLFGTNPVIVHPGATGEHAMAMETLRALRAAEAGAVRAAATPKLSITRRALSRGRLRVGCTLRAAELRSCTVTVSERRGTRTRRLRTLRLTPGTTRTVTLGRARRVVLRATAVAADGRRHTASRSYVRSR